VVGFMMTRKIKWIYCLAYLQLHQPQQLLLDLKQDLELHLHLELDLEQYLHLPQKNQKQKLRVKLEGKKDTIRVLNLDRKN
jgi:hypothetical protein